MGDLKKILLHALKERNKVKKNSHAEFIRKTYKEEYEKMEGKLAVWKSFQNNKLKNPTRNLVMIKKAYDHFVLVEKEVFNVEGIRSILRYAVTYNSLYSGQDRLELISGNK